MDVLVEEGKEIKYNRSFVILDEGFILDIIVQANVEEGRVDICKRQKEKIYSE
jgi:hypothetical protein